MAVLVQNIWRILLMVGLLVCSAFFSGSETAFFNISRRQLQDFGKSPNRLENMAASLLLLPNRLLTTILLCNMMINVLYFAFGSVLSINLGKNIHPAIAGITAVVTFLALLLFGEMLPKSIAYCNSRRFCLAATPICYLFVRVLAVLLAVFETVVVKPSVRLLTFNPGGNEKAKSVNVNLLRTLIETSRKEGLISKDENELLLEVIEFSHLKVRHVMKPRVDMLAGEISESPEKFRRMMHEKNLTKMPVYSGNIDNIVGMIRMRQLLLEPGESISKLMVKMDFVPEHKSVESMIKYFQKSGRDMAIAVDEYGGIAGQVLLEDIIDDLIDPILEKREHIDPIEQIGPMEYRLAGNLAIHDWAHAFGLDPGKSRMATVGGFMASLLGSMPKPGDVANLSNVRLTVEKVSKHRIDSLLLSFEPLSSEKSE